MNKKYFYLILVVFVGILTIYGWNQRTTTAAGKGNVYAALSELPDFRIEKVQGSYFLLHFWAKWCEPCAEEIPHLIEFAAAAKFKQPLKILAVSLDENLDTSKEILPNKGANLPEGFMLALDAKHQVAEKLGSYQYPETYWISPQGEILEKWVGAQKWQKPEVLEFFKQKLN